MANTFTNTQKVAAEAVRLLKNNLKFTGIINQKYSKTFKAPESVGESIDIRVPFNPSVRKNSATLVAQSFAEQTRTLKIDQQYGVDVSFSSLEKELDVKEYSDRVLRSEMANLATAVESKIMTDTINKCSNVISSATLSHTNVRQAKARLAQSLAPIDGRLTMFINPVDEVDILSGTETLFRGKDIESEYDNSSMGNALGFKWFESNLIPDYETGTNAIRGSAANTIEAVLPVEGASVLSITGATAVGTFKAGEIFQIEGVYDVNYQTKVAYPRLKTFVVAEDATAVAGAVTLTLGEPIYAGTGGFKNVSALPATGADIHFYGQSSSAYSQSFAFAPDFATVAFCDPRLPKGEDEAGKYMLDGVSARMVTGFDIINDVYPSRFDTYFGDTMLWQQWGTRITSAVLAV